MKLILGRQAILDRNEKIVAYELLFRTLDNTPIQSDTDATANVLSNTLNMFGSGGVLGSKKGFVNLGIDLIRKDILDILPPNKFVLEILETQTPSEELVQRIRDLKRRGYTFALDDFILNEEQIHYWDIILREVDIIKIDVMDTSFSDLQTKLGLLAPYKLSYLAEKVETQDMFEVCLGLGFHLYQGFYFTKPVIVEGKGFDLNTQGIMQIVKMIQQDSELSEIEEKIKLYPDLSISLLKLANSASIAPINEITSIKQTLALIGKRAIGQWLTLMLYSQHGPSEVGAASNALFLLAAQRGKMMEQIIKACKDPQAQKLSEESFLAGLLSLSDALLHMPLDKILEELSVSSVITDALLKKEGVLGTSLDIITAVEQRDIDKLAPLTTLLKIDTETVNHISIESYKYALNMARSL